MTFKFESRVCTVRCGTAAVLPHARMTKNRSHPISLDQRLVFYSLLAVRNPTKGIMIIVHEIRVQVFPRTYRIGIPDSDTSIGIRSANVLNSRVRQSLPSKLSVWLMIECQFLALACQLTTRIPREPCGRYAVDNRSWTRLLPPYIYP